MAPNMRGIDPPPPEGDEDWDDEAAARVAEVSPLVADAIGRALQSHYRAIAEIPLPDRFLVLLAELEARERANEA